MIRIMGLGFSGPKVPVAGWDAAGVVEAVGPGVTRFKPGDEIFGNCDVGGTGTFAEYVSSSLAGIGIDSPELGLPRFDRAVPH